VTLVTVQYAGGKYGIGVAYEYVNRRCRETALFPDQLVDNDVSRRHAFRQFST